MKLWIDDVRPAPEGYVWCKSVNETIAKILEETEYNRLAYVPDYIELLDLDHDAGDYASDGGDYIKLLDWLEREGYPFYKINIWAFRIHSMNFVGEQNMRRIIQRNGWKEIK